MLFWVSAPPVLPVVVTRSAPGNIAHAPLVDEPHAAILLLPAPEYTPLAIAISFHERLRMSSR